MGNESDKTKKNKIDQGLHDFGNISNPIMPTTNGRACTIEDGKVVLSFRHYKDEYNTLNSNLDKMKNKMNIIISEDSIEIMQMKLNQFKNASLNEETKQSLESFSSIYKTSLSNYYNLITEIKKIYKQSYLSISTFLTNWLKVQKDAETSGELSKLEEFENKIEETKNNFNNFSDIEEIINKICCFKIDYKNKNDIINEIKNYFEEHKDEIGKYYNFENSVQFRSLINIKEQINDLLDQKVKFIEILCNFHKEYLSMYKKILSQMNSTNLQKVEIVNEFNEFTGVVIYHRLIRSIEERIKKVKL